MKKSIVKGLSIGVLILASVGRLTAQDSTTVLHEIDFEAQNFELGLDKEDPSTFNQFLGLSSDFTFVVNADRSATATSASPNGEHLLYTQFYKGLPIESSTFKLHYKDNTLYYVDGKVVPNSTIDIVPTVLESDAFDVALSEVNAQSYVWDDPEELAAHAEDENSLIYPTPHGKLLLLPVLEGEHQGVRLAYKFDIYATSPVARYHIYIDAHTGQVLEKESRINTGTFETRYKGNRFAHTDYVGTNYHTRCQNMSVANTEWTTKLKRTGHPFSDANNYWSQAEYHNSFKDDAGLDVHWGVQETITYFNNHHNRSGWDNKGRLIRSEVNVLDKYGDPDNNAYWLGNGKMTFGLGQGSYDAWASLDIVAHEFGHGVNDATADLKYEKESGALDEGLSDIWGMCVEYFQAPGNVWRAAEDITNQSYNAGLGIRNFANPNFFGHPDTYGGTNWMNINGCIPDGDYESPTYNDYCWVHKNSVVLGHWFYRLVNGGSGVNDHGTSFNVTGISIEHAADIVYLTETAFLDRTDGYSKMAIKSIIAAQDLFGKCSQQVESVIEAWRAVGLGWAGAQYITSPLVPPFPTYHRYYHLVANNQIYPSVTTEYRASETITLNPGFEANYNSNFLAHIANCPTLGLKPSQDNNEPDKEALAAAGSSTGGGRPETRFLRPASAIKVFPNPARNLLNVEGTNALSYAIADLTGRILMRGNLDTSSVDISSLMVGNYIITVISKDGNKQHFKFNKQ